MHKLRPIFHGHFHLQISDCYQLSKIPLYLIRSRNKAKHPHSCRAVPVRKSKSTIPFSCIMRHSPLFFTHVALLHCMPLSHKCDVQHFPAPSSRLNHNFYVQTRNTALKVFEHRMSVTKPLLYFKHIPVLWDPSLFSSFNMLMHYTTNKTIYWKACNIINKWGLVNKCFGAYIKQTSEKSTRESNTEKRYSENKSLLITEDSSQRNSQQIV